MTEQIEDIEDIGRTQVEFGDTGRDRKQDFKMKQKMRKQKGKERREHMKPDEGSDCEVEFQHQDKPNLPGYQSIYVKTYGCSHNISDSEFMMGQLVDYGYQMCNTLEAADLVLINSCTVKNPSQQSFIGLVEQAKAMKKPVVVAGCVPQGDRSIEEITDVSIVGVTQIDRVVEVVEETLKGNKVQLLTKKDLPSLDLPKIRKNKYIEMFIPVNGGCLGACTYCKTKHARGKLCQVSYQPSALQQRVQSVVKEGVKQIWLTSEDTGAYGRDIGTNVATLLRMLVESLPPDVMLRIGMTNPPYILEHLENIATILNHPRVFSFLHIPVQSGSDHVLDRMNREYTREEFERVCDYLIQHVPGITIATDIICGFPGETEEQFEESLSLVDRYKFRVLNISQFYSRPGTAAEKMKKCNSKDVKNRSQRITKLFDTFDRWSTLMGTVQQVWIHEKEEKSGLFVLIGHTKTYAKVVLPYDSTLMGTSVTIRVEKVFKWHIEGTILDRNPKYQEVSVEYWSKWKQETVSVTEKKVQRILKEYEDEEKTSSPLKPPVEIIAPEGSCQDGCCQAQGKLCKCSSNPGGCGKGNCKTVDHQPSEPVTTTLKRQPLHQNTYLQTIFVVIVAFLLKEVLSFALQRQ